MLDTVAGALRVDDPNATGFKGVLQSAQGMFSEDLAKYQEGDINAAQVGLRAAGETGRTIGDTVGLAIAPVLSAAWNTLPDGAQETIQKGATEISQGIMDTDTAKATAAYLKNNPELARDLGSAVNMLDLAHLLPSASTSPPGQRGFSRSKGDGSSSAP